MRPPNILQQDLLRSADDLVDLQIIDFHRTNGLWDNNMLRAIRATSQLLIGHTAYTIVEIDMAGYPEHPGWPGWKHVGNHPHLGHLYWNYFHEHFKYDSPELHFSDMPDFRGSFLDEGGRHHIYGDIGRVSVSTFTMDVLLMLKPHDLWISVLDEKTQVILEPDADIGKHMRSLFGKPFERLNHNEFGDTLTSAFSQKMGTEPASPGQ